MLGELGARIGALREAGAERFDGPGLRFIEGLLRRAEGLDGRAEARLLERAAARLGALETAFAAAREEAAGAVAELEAEGLPVDAARAALAAGDPREAQRLASHLVGSGAELRAARERLERLVAAAEAGGVSVPEPARRGAGGADARAARRLGDDVARLLFREAAEEARSAVVVARAADQVPDQTGPYNARALTARALELAEGLSPTYLRALLASVEDLAALRVLPEPPKPKRRTRRR